MKTIQLTVYDGVAIDGDAPVDDLEPVAAVLVGVEVGDDHVVDVPVDVDDDAGVALADVGGQRLSPSPLDWDRIFGSFLSQIDLLLKLLLLRMPRMLCDLLTAA